MLATYVIAVLRGIAVQAKAGFTRSVLEPVAAQALTVCPTGSRVTEDSQSVSLHGKET